MEYWLDIGKLSNGPGLYVFARSYGKSFEPLYIGKAASLQRRVKGQLNNLKLMKGIRNAPNGKRYLLVAQLLPSPGVPLDTVLKTTERALIENALTDGHPILNIQGTKWKAHSITSTGNKRGRGPFAKTIFLRVR